jgi:hypothetical protein
MNKQLDGLANALDKKRAPVKGALDRIKNVYYFA